MAGILGYRIGLLALGASGSSALLSIQDEYVKDLDNEVSINYSKTNSITDITIDKSVTIAFNNSVAIT